MKLAWELDVSTTAFLVATDTDIHKLVAELGEFTRDREPREARHMQLRTLFSSHYDAPRIQFYFSFSSRILLQLTSANLKQSNFLWKSAVYRLASSAGAPHSRCCKSEYQTLSPQTQMGVWVCWVLCGQHANKPRATSWWFGGEEPKAIQNSQILSRFGKKLRPITRLLRPKTGPLYWLCVCRFVLISYSLSPMVDFSTPTYICKEPHASTHACAWILERESRQSEAQKPMILSVKRKKSWINLAEARRSNARQSPSTMSATASQSLKQVWAHLIASWKFCEDNLS